MNATAMGDGTPTGMIAVATTYAAAEAALGGDPSNGLSPTASVYLLYAAGAFTGAGEKGPPGTTPSPGRDLSVIVVAASLEQTVLALSNTAPHLGALGNPVSLQ